MPAVAAHYQFGQLALKKANRAVVAKVQAQKAMFDLGTQGPDLLFYFRPYQKNAISNIGSVIHDEQTAADFILAMWEDRANWSDAQLAYLLGFCCHYALDRRCHPFVGVKAPTMREHQALESAFDRLIIQKHQMTSRRQQLLPIKNISISALETCYPAVPRIKLREAVQTFHHCNHLLGNVKLVQGLERMIGKKGGFSCMCMPTGTIDVNAKLMIPLFDTAVSEATALMNLLFDNATSPAQLRQAMPENFEGVIIHVN